MGKKQHTNTSCNISVFLNSIGVVILGYLLRNKNTRTEIYTRRRNKVIIYRTLTRILENMVLK